MTKARLEQYNGYPAIMINGQPYPPMMATIRTNNRTDMIIDADYYRSLGESGIRIYFLICDTEWLKPGAFALFREEAETLLANVPDAYIMLRIGLHPPVQWCLEHPDELMSFSDGVRRQEWLFTESYEADYPATYSLCSQAWREAAGKALMETYEKVCALPYSDRIVGYFFAAGDTSEWYYMTGSQLKSSPDVEGFDVYGDFSGAFRQSFSNYLKEKYGDNETLRKAWEREDADIDNPHIPDCSERFYTESVDHAIMNPKRMLSNAPVPPPPANGTNIGSFLDINRFMNVFDYWRAWQLGTADSILYFGRLIKQKNPDLLTGAFYGGASCTNIFDAGQAGGVERVLRSGVIDFLANPGDYLNRQMGGFAGQRQAFDSYRLHNCMFIVEDDTRTHFENRYFANFYQVYNMEDSYNVLKRDFGRNVCQDLQAWWFDQILGGRRYKHPEIYRLFKRQQEIAREAYEKDRRKGSEIAFIFDEESMYVVSQETTDQLIRYLRDYEIEQIGAPSDQYYLRDMEDDRMPDYKLYVFVNTFYVDDKRRGVVRRKLRKNHATALFMYASGLMNPDRADRVSAENASEFIGIHMELLDGVYSGMFKFRRDSSHAIAKEMDAGEIYGEFTRRMMVSLGQGRYLNPRVNLYPLCFAQDAEAEDIACFVNTGNPAVSVKECDGYTSIYYGSKHITSDILRAAARYAGCHIYCESGDVLYANRSYITFHASKSGAKTLRLPEKKDVFEVYQQVYYGRNTDRISFEVLKGETLMFELRTADPMEKPR